MKPSALFRPSTAAFAIAIACGALFMGGGLHAATLTLYEFTPGNIFGPTNPNPAVVVSSIDQSVGDFDVSGTSGTAFLRASSSEANLAAALANPDYIQFTLSPATGQVISLESFIFDHEASNNTASAFTSNISIFASVTGFAVPPSAGDELGTSTVAIGANLGTAPLLQIDDVTFSLAAPQFQGLTSANTVTFRVYGFDDASLTDQIGRADDVRVIGSVVPEPSSLALLLGGIGMLARRRRR